MEKERIAILKAELEAQVQLTSFSASFHAEQYIDNINIK